MCKSFMDMESGELHMVSLWDDDDEQYLSKAFLIEAYGIRIQEMQPHSAKRSLQTLNPELRKISREFLLSINKG